jgi:Flp pilus assembly protein TadB
MYDEAVLDTEEKRFPDALAALKRALESGSTLEAALHDPALAELRHLPQFAALEKRFANNKR